MMMMLAIAGAPRGVSPLLRHKSGITTKPLHIMMMTMMMMMIVMIIIIIIIVMIIMTIMVALQIMLIFIMIMMPNNLLLFVLL